ncbi:MAG: twin transmembrane helix small protein [Gammaproteobacteria bacterium]|jgi:multisubunit Na+/H+ antiporter MnhF subunit
MPLSVKIFVIAMLIAIVASLGTALYRLARNRGGEDDTATVKALTIRVGLSIALFAILMILSALGIVTPNA